MLTDYVSIEQMKNAYEFKQGSQHTVTRKNMNLAVY